jgi:DNA-binding CsgD family transcriptional regulator
MGEAGFSALIGGIYDAALDAALWPGVLDRAAAFVRGSAASLFYKDAATKTGAATYVHGLDPGYVSLYFSKYIKLDPTTTVQFFAALDEPVATDDLVPYDEFLESRFYREWARPQRLVDCVSVTLDKSITTAAMFAVFRSERDGRVDAETRRRIALLAPHIRRAVIFARVIDLKTHVAAGLADGLDAIRSGAFLLGADARIVHANTAAHAMLESGDLLWTGGDRLIAREAAVDRTLREALAAHADAARGVSVPLTATDGTRYVAHIVPFAARARRGAGTAHAAVAAMFVHEATVEVPSPPEVIAKAYRLTPTELRVLLAIVEIGGVPEVAEALGIAETTVKTHLGRLYDKTGACRQADLVKIVAGFSSPLVA